MKKFLIITITLCMLFVLTACSSKENKNEGTGLPINNTDKKEEKKEEPVVTAKYLNCSKDYSSQMSNGITMTQDVEMKFVDNKIQDFSMSMNFEVPSSLASSADTLVESMKKTYDDKYGVYDGVTVTLKRTSQTVFTIVIAIDFPNISATDKKALNLSGSEDYSVNRTSFINSGYTCD